MKKIIGATLFVVYSIVAIIVTVLLLSFNQYNISEIGGYTVYIANNDQLEPDFDKGSILIIEETSDKHVQIGDEIFLYKVISSQEYEVVKAKLEQKTQQGRHIVYTVDTGESYANDYFIGRVEDTSTIGAPWGTILSILESKWGYLFCIVIVSLLLFLQEVFNLIIELKYGSKTVKTTTKKASTTAKKTAGTTKKTTTTKKPAEVAKKETVPTESAAQETGEKE